MERNLRNRLGEIDLVTKAKDGTIVFVEVRTRSGPGAGRAALDSVHGEKRRRLWNAASAHLARAYPEEPARIDLIAVAAGPDGSLEIAEHVVNAIEEPD